MTWRTSLRSLLRDRRGVTVIEFALISVPLMLFLLGTLELGRMYYVQGVMQGAVQEAVRVAGIGGASLTTAQIDQIVKDRLKTLVAPANLSFERKSYTQFSGVGRAEPLTTDKNNNGSYDPGDCFTDMNGNGVYDTDQGRTGLGGGDDIFYYRVQANLPRIIPFSNLFGVGRTIPLAAETMMRNQPYAAQVVPATVCV